MGKQLTNDEFIKKLYEKNVHFRDRQFKVTGEYVGMHYPIECECTVHGKWTISEANDLVKGSGCPICAKKSRQTSNTKTTNAFLEELVEKNSHYRNGEFQVTGEYLKSDAPVDCYCPIHGTWKTSTPNHLLSRNGSCPECAKPRRRNKLSRTMDQFLDELLEKNSHYRNGEFRVVGKYINSDTPIVCECLVHGKWDTSRPSDLLHGGGCPKCSGVAKLSKDEFLEKLYEKNEHYRNGEFKVVGEYINQTTPIDCECPIHGVWTSSRPGSLLNGNIGCPMCKNTSTSFAENYIRSALKEALPDADIPDKGDRKLLDGLEIDIPVYKYGFAVEFGAWHWHKDKYESDIEKRKLLEEKGIKLYTIYDSFDGTINMSELDDSFIVYSIDLAQEKNWVTLQQIIIGILEDEHLPYGAIDWELVRQNTEKLSSIKSTSEFLKELFEKNTHYQNGEFKVIGKYVSGQRPIKCVCSIHGTWKTSSPNYLLNRNGTCPKCSGKNKTTDEFLKELSERNEYYRRGEFKVLGEYEGAIIPIECECPVHGKWKTKPNYLLKGVGCKKCSYAKNADSRKMSTADFIEKLIENNSHFRKGEFKVVGEYTKSGVPVACECPIHGVWKTSHPSSLLNGSGCPKCSGVAKLSKDEFLEKLLEKNSHYQNGEFKVVGDYINAVTPIVCECPIHGVWETRPSHLLSRSTGCPECGKKAISRANYKAVLCVDTGTVYNSIKEAAEKNGVNSISIGNCCKGKQKTAGKLHWKFFEKE